jgi:hypothetical protein
MAQVHIQVVTADALSFAADILILKHAQALYGVDRSAYSRLSLVHDKMLLPLCGEHSLFNALDSVTAKRVLFVGVERLPDFGYAEIREFGRRAIAVLAQFDNAPKHIALTIHGANFGLDEIEAFKAELAGVVEAISEGEYPQELTDISFVESDERRSARLSSALQLLLPNGLLQTTELRPLNDLGSDAQSALLDAGTTSVSKPHVFVAMPFVSDMDDVFHYGIQGAINAASMLAERADLSSFTGDVMDWVKARISSATLVVADLTSSNPNVYLEVGYAWGCGVPTVLLTRMGDALKFDTQGQRCIVYTSIKDLEEKLAHELKQLKL